MQSHKLFCTIAAWSFQVCVFDCLRNIVLRATCRNPHDADAAYHASRPGCFVTLQRDVQNRGWGAEGAVNQRLDFNARMLVVPRDVCQCGTRATRDITGARF